jgi:acetyl-CoA C-acetyltransferase
MQQHAPYNTPVIISAVRTPIGKFGRSLKDYSAPKLGGMVIREALRRASQIRKQEIGEVIMGNAVSAGIGQNPARQALMLAGLSYKVGATTIGKVCGSGLKAIMLAAQAIRSGDTDCVIAGGMESMSQCPYLVKDIRWGLKYGDLKILDSMLLDGLWEVYNDYHMGITGEVIAKRYRVSRDEADKFALSSYKKALKAIQRGDFRDEIIPVEHFDVDECVRAGTTLSRLASLDPVFKPDGILTAGNSSQLADGASAVIVTSEDFARSTKQTILARIVGYGQAGVKPELVMEAPIYASKAVLRKAGLTIGDIDLVEHNEAYASASIVIQRELDIPTNKFNVNGGAIALGHPIGCSGARLVTTMVHSLEKRRLHRGLVTLCLGGGEAVSMVIESCNNN